MSNTTPTREASEVLAVTQADREAAAPFMAGTFAASVRAGVCDRDPFVQAFARHRIEALASISLTPPAVGEGEVDDPDALTGCADDDTFADINAEAVRAALATLRPSPDAIREALGEAQQQLEKAADQFAFYADEHAKKRTSDGDAKAMVNHQWALACAKADHRCRAALHPSPVAEAASPDAIREALENLLIAIGMGWDLDDVIDVAQRALATPEGRTTDKGEG